MRYHRLIAALAGFLAIAGPAFAQTFPAEAVILLPEVEVRSGPSKTFFPTSKLKQNEKVVILRESKEAPGWYEIKPPVQSFSWIKGKDVKQIDPTHAFVDCDPSRPAEIFAGSRVVDRPPDRISMKLTAGQIVVLVDRPMTVGTDIWLPIQPHAQEVRYIPADAVRPAVAVATMPTGPASWTLTPSGYTTNNALADAEKAYTAGDMNRARQLYQTVANTATDPSQRQYATNKLASLPQGPFTTASSTRPDQTTTAFSASSAGTKVGNLMTLKAAEWSTYGRLRDTKMLREDGQPIYSLEDAQGKTIGYVTTNPDKSLVSYLGRWVSVYGPTMYRPDSAARMQYIVASHVAVP